MSAVNASQSAAIIAAHRAIESAKPSSERICYDPFAEKLISSNTTVIGETDLPREQALEIFKQFVPGFHEYFLARTRYIDDYLAASVERGLGQLVILGAGYDSRAYRFEALKESAAVFEVDHPATQTVKQQRLAKIFQTLPGHVTFVPVDLQSENLGGRLTGSGYDDRQRTVFIWEGVTMYLNPQAVDQTLAFIARHSGPGSEVIFDFTSPAVIQGDERRPEAAAWRQKASDSGEPLRFGLRFDRLKPFLRQRNFSEITMVTHDFFDRAYFSDPEDNRQVTPILAIAHGTRLS